MCKCYRGGENLMDDQWCEVIAQDEGLDNVLKNIYIQARRNGHSKLETYGAMMRWMNVITYVAEIDIRLN